MQETGHQYTIVPPLSVVLLLAVSAAHRQWQSENTKWKVPESSRSNASCLSSKQLLWLYVFYSCSLLLLTQFLTVHNKLNCILGYVCMGGEHGYLMLLAVSGRQESLRLCSLSLNKNSGVRRADRAHMERERFLKINICRKGVRERLRWPRPSTAHSEVFRCQHQRQATHNCP